MAAFHTAFIKTTQLCGAGDHRGGLLPGDRAVRVKLAAANAVDNAAAVSCADITGVPFAAGNVRKDFRVLCSQTEGAGDDSGKFCARHSLVWHECPFSHAVDDAAGREFFNSSFVRVILDV